MNTEIIQITLSLLTVLGVLFAIMLAYLMFRRFMRDRSIEREREYSLRMMETEKLSNSPQPPERDVPVVDPSGYILINLPDSQKTIFMDLLKGFEEYAILKGYKISFSYDGSLPNKVAFRFTILQGGITVSSDKVREDLQEYIGKVQNGDTFDDLDIVIPPEQHHITHMILKNRLTFLQSTYTAQKNALQLYERLIKTFGSNSLASGNPQFFIQGSGAMSPSQYSAVNSQQIAQGQHIKMIGNTSDQTLNIGNTFNDTKLIAEKIDKVISLLYQEKEESQKSMSYEAGTYLRKAKDEICDEVQPDESRLRRYLEKAREIFSTATFAKGAVDAFQELLEMIGIF